jgi:pseudaminic acid biosynthesis-associated methylase
MTAAAANKQEQLWRSEFGDAYIDRNAVADTHLAALTRSWTRILASTLGRPPKTIFEGGANIGLNLRALRRLTDARFLALEPNAKARQRLLDDQIVEPGDVIDGLLSGIDLPDGAADLSFTSGVLIHVPPRDLLASVSELVRVSRRYVVCIEYFADKPVEVPYRGQTEALFKRDFGGFYLEHFPELRVLDYGFLWKPMSGLDNLTWQLFEKDVR